MLLIIIGLITASGSFSRSSSVLDSGIGIIFAFLLGKFSYYPLIIAAICYIIGAIRHNTLQREADERKRAKQEQLRLAQQANAQKMQQDQLNELIRQNQMLMEKLSDSDKKEEGA